MRTARFIAVLALASAACTNVKLWRAGQLEKIPGVAPVAEEVVDPSTRYSVGDVFCTAPAREVVTPFKLLVIIDYSGSNLDTDPGGVRIDAVQALLDQYKGEPNLYFGFLTFASAAQETVTAKGFSNDPSVLDAVMQDLRSQPLRDATNYQTTLEWAYEAISKDIASKEYIAGTKYGIIFLTDGRPNVPENSGDPDGDLMANRPKIRERITGCGGYFGNQPPLRDLIEFLNTYYYNSFGADALASQLLQDMAEGPSSDACAEDNWGHGEFHEVTNVADLDLSVALPTMRKVYINDRNLLFLNYNLRAAFLAGEMTMALDSDGDGLIDDLEDENPDASDRYATDRFDWDTDDDGISDLVEFVLGDQANLPSDISAPRPPLLASNQSKGLFVDEGEVEKSDFDTDGDGLTNAEETLLGTKLTEVDSDKDGLTDYIEVRFFLNPLLAEDASLDIDGDGRDNKTEIVEGMDPHHPEPQAFREKYAYTFTWGREAASGGKLPKTCYEFKIDNIAYEPTLMRDGNKRDLNVFELNFIDHTRLPAAPSDTIGRRDIVFAQSREDAAVSFRFSRGAQNPW